MVADAVSPSPCRNWSGMSHGTADLEHAALHASGLFLAAWYLACYADVAAAGIDPLTHFCAAGWREGRHPNPYFDPAWYLTQNPDLRQDGMNPLLHYVRDGEHEGRRPILWFDPAWYRAAHAVPPDVSALAHFLAQRQSGTVSPIPEFD